MNIYLLNRMREIKKVLGVVLKREKDYKENDMFVISFKNQTESFIKLTDNRIKIFLEDNHSFYPEANILPHDFYSKSVINIKLESNGYYLIKIYSKDFNNVVEIKMVEDMFVTQDSDLIVTNLQYMLEMVNDYYIEKIKNKNEVSFN